MAAKVNKKGINKRADNMENGWELKAAETFRRKSLQGLKDIRTEIDTAEQEKADIDAQGRLKDIQIDGLYQQLDDYMVDVGDGVRGHEDYGSDSELYGAMGFVRKSQRKSGLTRKNKNKDNDENS